MRYSSSTSISPPYFLKHRTLEPDPDELVLIRVLVQDMVRKGRKELPMSNDSPCQTFERRGFRSGLHRENKPDDGPGSLWIGVVVVPRVSSVM